MCDDQNALQADLLALGKWALDWGMKFNPSKCSVLTFSSHRQRQQTRMYTLCGVFLQNVTEAKYLGINLSSDLKWSLHIQQTASKANSMLGLLRRNISRCATQLREQAYFALIRSRLEYCAAIWDPHLAKDVNRLESVQRRAARFVKQANDPCASVSAMLRELNWLPLKERRRDIRLAFLFQIIKGGVAVQAEDYLTKADSRTRNLHAHKYRHINSNSDQFKNSFFVRTIPQWNDLTEASVNADTARAFKASLRPTP